MQTPDTTRQKVLRILYEEVIPAQGCTEPIAIAYAAAKAREVIPDEEISEVSIRVSGNIIKNVKSVVVPNSGGMVGIEVSAVMGFMFGDASRDLEVISDITIEQMEQVRVFMETATIEVLHVDTPEKLYIEVELRSTERCGSVEIKHFHTNITKIKRDQGILISQPCNDKVFNTPEEDRSILSIALICELAKTMPLEQIEPLMSKVIILNSKIAHEGLSGNYGINIGRVIRDQIESGFYGDDIRNRAASFAAAGSDARMSGSDLPVMTTSGSGNQGMTASLALIKYAAMRDVPREQLIRALFFSHLATVHIKSNVGRLSAYCGVICAAAAVSGALCFIDGHELETISHAIANTLGDVSGIICDGAKASCAMKISTTVTAAFDSYVLATHGEYMHGGDGIIANDIEQTLVHVGKLAGDGMKETDEVILDIMRHNYR